jgi:hypothetical protein
MTIALAVAVLAGAVYGALLCLAAWVMESDFPESRPTRSRDQVKADPVESHSNPHSISVADIKRKLERETGRRGTSHARRR